jgi:hypothetical protein
MSHDFSNVSMAFGLFARSDFQVLPMEVQGFVAKILGLTSVSQVDSLDLQVSPRVLEQAFCFVVRALFDALSVPTVVPVGLSSKPDAIRKRKSRAQQRANKQLAEASSSSKEPRHQPCDTSQSAAMTDAPARDTSQPVSESPAVSNTYECDMSQAPCLFVNGDLKIQKTNKPSDAREREVLDALMSHEQLADVATPQLAHTIAQEAPDVDVPTLAGKLAAQFSQRKPSINPAGYIRAVFKNQQVQQVQNTGLNEKASKKQVGEMPQKKAKSLPISAGRFEREDLLQPLHVECLPEQMRQEGLLAMKDILAGLRAVA